MSKKRVTITPITNITDFISRTNLYSSILDEFGVKIVDSVTGSDGLIHIIVFDSIRNKYIDSILYKYNGNTEVEMLVGSDYSSIENILSYLTVRYVLGDIIPLPRQP